MKPVYQTINLLRDDIKKDPKSTNLGTMITTSCTETIKDEQYYLPLVDLIELILIK